MMTHLELLGDSNKHCSKITGRTKRRGYLQRDQLPPHIQVILGLHLQQYQYTYRELALEIKKKRSFVFNSSNLAHYNVSGELQTHIIKSNM